MKNFTKIILFIFLILFDKASGYSEQHLDMIKKGRIILPFAILNYAKLKNYNFNKAFFKHAWLKETDLQKSSFIEANLSESFCYKTNFENTTLLKTNFKNCILFKTNITTAAALNDANFENVKGLSNQEKKELKNKGALNIPEDLTEEEFEAEKKLILAKLNNPYTEYLDYLFDSFLWAITLGYYKPTPHNP